MSNESLTVRCRTCGKLVKYRPGAEDSYFPFCSERCKLMDLGKWFGEEHRISEPAEDEPPSPDDSEPAEESG